MQQLATAQPTEPLAFVGRSFLNDEPRNLDSNGAHTAILPPSLALACTDSCSTKNAPRTSLHVRTRAGVVVDKWPIEQESGMPEQYSDETPDQTDFYSHFFDTGKTLDERGVKMTGLTSLLLMCTRQIDRAISNPAT